MINKALELGPKYYQWWPDWRGEVCAIVAGGASLKGMNVNVLRDRAHVIAIKVAVDLAPWAEICYGCDSAWWISRQGVPSFSGIKLFHGIQVAHRFANMYRIEIDMKTDAILVDHPLKVGNGGNSGHQAINLAVQFGARDIILLGFDCHDRKDVHWYGRNKWENANNPMGTNFRRWKEGFDVAKKSLDKLGIDVVNCSPNSAISTFRQHSLEQVMEEWGL